MAASASSDRAPKPAQEPEPEPEPQSAQERAPLFVDHSSPGASSPHTGSPRTPTQTESLPQTPSTDHSRRRSSGRVTWSHGSGRRARMSPDASTGASLDRSTARCAHSLCALLWCARTSMLCELTQLAADCAWPERSTTEWSRHGHGRQTSK